MSVAQNVTELAAGLAEAAQELGDSCTVYRSADTSQPIIAVGSQQGTVLAAFPVNYSYKQSPSPNKPFRVAVIDTTAINVSDYVQNNTTNEIHYIASKFTLQPVVAVNCNAFISIYSQSELATKGNVGRLGDVIKGTAANEKLKLNSWPGSLLYIGRGGKTLNILPTDDEAPQFAVLLPNLSITVSVRDVVTSDIRRFVIRAVERNVDGLRLICMQIVQ